MFKFSPKGTLAGGTAVILWCFISWMVLPWHQFLEIKNPLELTGVISTSTPKNGVYIFPNIPDNMDSDSLKSYSEMKTKGPSGILFVSSQGTGGFGFSMVLIFIGHYFAAMLFSILINLSNGLDILQKGILVSLAAMSGGFICLLPYFVWWHFPFTWTLINVLDLGLGWFLGGLILAKYSSSYIDINFHLFPLGFLKKKWLQG